MEIRVKFIGGPLDRQTALIDSLDELRVFFPSVEGMDRQVLVYQRQNETDYHYNHDISTRMTAKYDESKDWFGKLPNTSLRFDGVPRL